MVEDAAARALLDEVVVEWAAGGVLNELCDLVSEVWRRNSDRHEPTRLGDDAVSLGVQCSRNLCNLAVRRFGETPGVQARDVKTLEVTFRGRVLHVGKVRSRVPHWDVTTTDWSQSDVRNHCAEANSKAYVSLAGTLFEHAGWQAKLPDPGVLRYLQLMWQGLDGGRTRVWLGFPSAGEQAWFAVVLLDDRDSGDGVAMDGTAPITTPDFDSIGEPALKVTRKPSRDVRPRSAGA